MVILDHEDTEMLSMWVKIGFSVAKAILLGK